MSAYHYPLAASSAEGWGHCSYYFRANKDKPNEPTADSLAGEAAHWVGAECLRAWRDKVADSGAPLCSEWLGKHSPEGVIIDRKMIEGAQIYVDECLKIAQKHGALKRMLIEHPVKMSRIHELNGGTMDFGLVLPELGLVYVIDYKHGHRLERARENFQLIDYAEGLIEEFEIADQGFIVTLGIVQPFCYNNIGPLDEWKLPLTDLRGYFNIMFNKAHEAFTNPTMSTGLWCRDCAAVLTCSARRGATYNMIDYVDAPIEIDAMSSRDMAIERQILTDGQAATKSRLEALEAELEYRIARGDAKSGLSLAQGKRGSLNWTCEPAVAIAFGEQFGVDAKQPEKAITATQLKDSITSDKRPLFDATINNFAERSPGKFKLTHTRDTVAARAFKKEI